MHDLRSRWLIEHQLVPGAAPGTRAALQDAQLEQFGRGPGVHDCMLQRPDSTLTGRRSLEVADTPTGSWTLNTRVF